MVRNAYEDGTAVCIEAPTVASPPAAQPQSRIPPHEPRRTSQQSRFSRHQALAMICRSSKREGATQRLRRNEENKSQLESEGSRGNIAVCDTSPGLTVRADCVLITWSTRRLKSEGRREGRREWADHSPPSRA